jgi:hypothetical protein
MGRFAFDVVRVATLEHLGRWEPADPFDPRHEIKTGLQFDLDGETHTVSFFELYDQRREDGDGVDGRLHVI